MVTPSRLSHDVIQNSVMTQNTQEMEIWSLIVYFTLPINKSLQHTLFPSFLLLGGVWVQPLSLKEHIIYSRERGDPRKIFPLVSWPDIGDKGAATIRNHGRRFVPTHIHHRLLVPGKASGVLWILVSLKIGKPSPPGISLREFYFFFL